MGAEISTPADVSLTVFCGDKPEGSTATIRSPAWADKPLAEIPFEGAPDINTTFHVFQKTVREHGPLDFLGQRHAGGPFVFESYTAVAAEVEAIGSALLARGLTAGQTVGIFSINRPEWTKTLLGLWSQSLVCVPLYDTLGASSVEFILKDASVTTIFVAPDKLKHTLTAAKSYPGLRTLVVLGDVTPELEAAAAAASPGLALVAYAALLAEGRAHAAPAAPPAPDALAYIMYTSGTTGNPKGVMLTHRNILASASGLFRFGIEFYPTDVYLSYLPLAHSFETVMQILTIIAGGSIGFYQGDARKLTDDIAALRPTVFAGVPRVYSRIYDRVQSTVAAASWLRRTMFEKAYATQAENLMAGRPRSALLDSLVFSKTAASLGGRLRLMATGAAPLPAHLHTFLSVVFMCPLLQGYGLTENAAAAAGCPMNYRHAGRIGVPLPCCEVKLVDIPEMNYLSSDEQPRGEVCLRGPNIFAGYFNAPDKTAETLDADGWLHTGDVGRLNADGSLSIIDRKKNIFKLAQGEYVAAEELENIFGKASTVGQIFVYGDSFKTVLVTIVVPNLENLKTWCAANGVEGNLEAICGDERVRAHVMGEIAAAARAEAVASFKIPKALHLEHRVNELGQGFTVENDTLTPTFKLRRPQLLHHYRPQIDAMYVALGEGPTQTDRA